MKLSEAFDILQEVAPVKLSDDFCREYSLYDNSGIILNCGKDVSGALFALDLSYKAVLRAAELGFDLIVTHHPAIYGGIKRLDVFSDAQSKALAECIKRGISVISMHLNFDAAPKGIDYYLMRGLGGEKATVCHPVTGGGYGRAYCVPERTFADYERAVKREFNSERILFYGDKESKVKKVASFCGAGCDDKTMAFAESVGADTFVSSDMKHHELIWLLGRGIKVIHMPHYVSENYGFGRIYDDIKSKQSFGIPSEYFSDDLLG